MSNTGNMRPVKGTHDLFDEAYKIHKFIGDYAQKVADLYCFKGMTTPIFEHTDIFKRNLGESSDVVNKEMYSFDSKGGESLTLRPEFTASIVRAFISNGLKKDLPLKLFSTGPLFRYERPQKGRQRQFHQVNFEWLGASPPYSDVQMILMAQQFLQSISITEYTLEINTLGDEESKVNYRKILVEYLSDYEDELSADSKNRLTINPLRILDSKDEGDRKILANAPKTIDYLSPKSQKIFDDICSSLDNLAVKYVVNPKIVRGLDYYNDMVFEFISQDIGAQGTILAGGRYDNLVQQMGGGDVPAIGFAAGIERLSFLASMADVKNDVTSIITDCDNADDRALIVANILRNNNIKTEVFTSGNFSKRMKKINNIGVESIVILRNNGEFEVKGSNNNHIQDIITRYI